MLTAEYQLLNASLPALVQQHAFRLLRVYWAVEQFVSFQEDFDEGGPRGDCSLNQRLGQRVFNVFLKVPVAVDALRSCDLPESG